MKAKKFFNGEFMVELNDVGDFKDGFEEKMTEMGEPMYFDETGALMCKDRFLTAMKNVTVEFDLKKDNRIDTVTVKMELNSELKEVTELLTLRALKEIDVIIIERYEGVYL